MLIKGFFIYAAFAALAFASEIEDGEQKKRGAGKANTLNAIPTGAQKSDYTYSIYSQSSPQSNPSQYQNQVPNSFYPNQASQYFSPSNNADSTTSPLHTQVSPQVAQPIQSHFVPINVYPGYQPKYQILSARPGNLQLAVMPAYQPSSIVQYPHPLFSQTTNQITPQSAALGTQGHFNLPTLPLSLGGSFIGQPSMVVIPSHPNLYNNLVYPNPAQSFYNYYPSNSQAKYSYASGSLLSQSNDYDKVQTISHSSTKDDNSGQSTEYIAPVDSNSAYKNAYSSGSAYSKL